MMLERGLLVDQTTIYRWVQAYALKSELADDGFELANEHDEQLAEVVGFLESKVGSVYLAKVQRDARNCWALDPATLAPFFSK